MTELPDDVMAKIRTLTDQGNAWMEDEDFDGAIEQFEEALQLVPEPWTDWEAATWILTAIGDAYFLSGGFQEAWEAFNDAIDCPGAKENPFVQLRLGQSEFELGNMDLAAKHLGLAYKLDGERVFEDEEPKYLELAKRQDAGSTRAAQPEAPSKPWWKFW